VRLGDGVGIALSPDSAWALTRTFGTKSQFVLVPVKTGQPKTFPPDDFGRTAYGAFVPDGSKFVFVGSPPGRGNRLYVQDVAGGAPRPISEEGLIEARSIVSPDARWVAAIGPDNKVHLYPLAGGTPTDLEASKTGDSPAGWAADGKGLYVSQLGFPCTVDLIDIASGKRTRVRELAGTDAGGVNTFGPVRVTPDGKTMLAGMVRVLSTLYQVEGLK
jgi:Tol biopolymer transport system component